jgi:hypothetical protein
MVRGGRSTTREVIASIEGRGVSDFLCKLAAESLIVLSARGRHEGVAEQNGELASWRRSIRRAGGNAIRHSESPDTTISAPRHRWGKLPHILTTLRKDRFRLSTALVV